MTSVKKNVLTALKISFAFGLIFYLIFSGNLNLHFMSKAITLHPWWLLIVASLTGLVILIATFRWHMLILAQGVTITFWKTLGLSFVGMFFNICLPGATGGDLAKCYYLAVLYPDNKLSTITTVLVDRVLGLSGLVLVGGISILLAPAISIGGGGVIRTMSYSVLLVGTGIVIGIALFLNFPVSFIETYSENLSCIPGGKLFLRFYRAVRIYRDKQSVIYLSLLLSMAVHTSTVLMSIIVGKIIGSDLSWRFYGVITPLGLLANALPIAPAGLGVGEAAFEYLYHLVNSPFGSEIIAILHLISICWGLVGLPFYLFIKKSPVSSIEKGRSIEWSTFYEK